MVECLSAADVAVLHRESRTAPQPVGGSLVFTPRAGGFPHDRPVRLLERPVRPIPGSRIRRTDD